MRTTPTTVRYSNLARLTPAVLVLAAGSAAAHGQFVFSPVCNSNWNGTCSAGTCVGGGFQTVNNWSQSNCGGGSLAGPGAGNSVTLPAGAVFANVPVGIASLSTAAGTVLHVQANFGIGTATAITCAWQVDGGNNTMSGTYTNGSTMTWLTGWTSTLNNFVLTNNGVLDVQYRLFGASGVTGITNTGTFRKSTGNGVTMTGVPISHQGGVMSIDDGTLSLNSLGFLSAAAGSWSVSAPGAVVFNGGTMSGSYLGVNNGLFRVAGQTVTDNSVFNITGQGVDISGNLTVAAGKTLTNSGLLNNIQGNNTVTGTITNTGTYRHDTGWSTTLTGGTLTNTATGTLDLRYRNFGNGGGAALVNHGAVTKTTGNSVNLTDLPFTNNASLAVSGGAITFSNCPIVAGASSTWNVPAGQMTFNGCTMHGTFTGSNAGLWRLQTATIDDNSTLAVSGVAADINGHLTVAAGKTLTNNGLLNNIQGNNTITGNLTNNGTFAHGTGWTTVLTAGTLTNTAAGTLDLVYRNFSNGGGAALVNHGAVTKASGNSVNFTDLPFTNNASLAVSGGAVTFTNCPIVAGASSTWNVPAGQLTFNGCTMHGTFTGSNAGLWRLQTATIDDNSTLAVAGLAADLNGNLTVSPGKTLTNNGLLNNIQGPNTITGNLTNNGTFAHGTGWTTTLTGGTLTNTAIGTLDLVYRDFANGGGGSIVNNGTITKTGGSPVNVAVPVTNSGLISATGGTLNLSGSTLSNTSTLRSNATIVLPAGFNFAAGRMEGTACSA